MDPFLRYLLVINVATFLAFVLDLLLCLRFPSLDSSAANALVMDLFPIVGGAAGMLLALFVLAGLGRGHRINKDNVAWWFLALLCLVTWGLPVAARYGLVTLDTSPSGILTGWSPDGLRTLLVYAAVINIVTFVAFAWDKHVAASGNDLRRRTPEAWLLGLGFVGGSLGGMLAMALVRHKTRKWYFVWGLPTFALLNVATVVYAHMAGLL